jgi:CheY-like chemotaxis protein
MPHQGTEMPDTNPPAPGSDGPQEAAAPPLGLRILIADDNHDSADSMSLLLQLSGYEVHAAYDGAQAFAEAEAFRPHFAVLDIAMPGVDGYEAAQRIRAQPWGKDMILVAMSGFGQESDKQQAQAAGFDHHLTKPVDVTELERLLPRV